MNPQSGIDDPPGAPGRSRSRLGRSAAGSALVVGAAVALAAVAAAALLPTSSIYPLKVLAGYAAVLVALFAWLGEHHPHDRFGGANQTTLLRAGMVCLLAALLGEPWLGHQGLVASVAIVALALDGIDGWLARREGTTSAFGGRFDMETDALLVLVLSLLAWESGRAGPWVLAAGLMRYGFVAAAFVWPWLSRPLPPSQRRKTFCVLQLVGLVACLTPLANEGVRTASAVAAVLVVTVSFAIDVAWLARQRVRSAPLG